MFFYAENGTYSCRFSGRLFGSKSFIDPYTEPGKSAEKEIKLVYNSLFTHNKLDPVKTTDQQQRERIHKEVASPFGFVVSQND